MKTEQNICESCKTRPVEKLEHPDKGLQPYHLCKQCQYRLFNYALRPLEFFNLVAIYGHGYYLHDDFYDYKNGEATQPKTDLEEPGKFPFPDLHSINTDLEKAVNFACVQNFTSSEVIELLKNLIRRLFYIPSFPRLTITDQSIIRRTKLQPKCLACMRPTEYGSSGKNERKMNF